jgi:hypothetical protein
VARRSESRGDDVQRDRIQNNMIYHTANDRAPLPTLLYQAPGHFGLEHVDPGAEQHTSKGLQER